MNQYSVVIIGCGKIAGGYDKPGSKHILSHANAITNHSRTVLTGVYDIDPEIAASFAKKWNTIAYHSIKTLFDSCEPDIVIITSTTLSHLDIIEDCIKQRPKAIICEKPFGNNIKRARKLNEELQKSNILLSINFSRRFDNTIIELKKDIDNKKYGSFINGSAIYAKGIKHNGSHLINLLLYLFGAIESYTVLNSRHDFFKDDPTLDVFLKFSNGNVFHLVGADENKYTVFELDFLFESRRINYFSAGFKRREQSVINDPLYPGYLDLSEWSVKETGLKNSLLKLLDNVINTMENRETLICPGGDGIRTQAICESLLKM